jgi:hypothetical protein
LESLCKFTNNSRALSVQNAKKRSPSLPQRLKLGNVTFSSNKEYLRKMVSTRGSRTLSKDGVGGRADNLRKLDLGDVDKDLSLIGRERTQSQISDNAEEDDVAIANAINEVESDIAKGNSYIIPLALNLIIVLIAFVYREQLLKIMDKNL